MKTFILNNLTFFTCICAFASPALASNDQTITWYKPEFPPLSIVNGPDAGKGYSDRIEQFLIHELKGYKHQILVSPFKRTLRDMKKGLNACSVTLLKNPEREKFIAFTQPARLLLPNSLVIRKTDLGKLAPYTSPDGKVSVEQIIQNKLLRIGYSNGRSYTKPIDDILKEYKGSPILVERLGKEGPKGLLTMLSRNYIDAMFMQPVEAQYHARRINLDKSIAVLPIAEIKDYTVGYIGCSKTPWGEQVIKQINALMKDAVKSKEFKGFYEEFLDDASKIRYRKVYDAFFDTQ